MPTDNPAELRSPAPSLFMRVITWLIARRPPVFPHDTEGFHRRMTGRPLPADAPMPERFRRRFVVEEREVQGREGGDAPPAIRPRSVAHALFPRRRVRAADVQGALAAGGRNGRYLRGEHHRAAV